MKECGEQLNPAVLICEIPMEDEGVIMDVDSKAITKEC